MSDERTPLTAAEIAEVLLSAIETAPVVSIGGFGNTYAPKFNVSDVKRWRAALAIARPRCHKCGDTAVYGTVNGRPVCHGCFSVEEALLRGRRADDAARSDAPGYPWER